jgi:putative transposase
MSQSKCSLDLYTRFLIANKNNYSGVELAKVKSQELSHDSISKWLREKEPDVQNLWPYVEKMVDKKVGYIVVDDSVLDKSYSKKNELTNWHYSGNVHGLVNGIDIVNLLWTNGDECIPVDYRIYQTKEKKEYKTKNDHFQDLLNRVKTLDFKPFYVLADAWYGSVANMKFIDKKKWKFIFGAKENRLVSITKNVYVHISDLDWTKKQVQKVWLKEYGYVLVARIVFKDESVRYVVTNDLKLTKFSELKGHNDHRWNIETFHRGIKQTTGIEKCYSILEKSQRSHIFACFVAFIKLEYTRIQDHISWYEQKAQLIRVGTRIAMGA